MTVQLCSFSLALWVGLGGIVFIVIGLGLGILFDLDKIVKNPWRDNKIGDKLKLEISFLILLNGTIMIWAGIVLALISLVCKFIY